ncbi:MAG: hypothetical protein FJY11_08575, partial [Bacteroidetes bacterium]|nr:hypothetical protein [Bacteroidota bacterium]
MKILAGILLTLTLICPEIRGMALNEEPPFLKYTSHPWVDSLMKTLTLEEKIAQLIWIDAFANRDIGYD